MQAVIFDFDGPLFDGRKAYVRALTSTIERFPPEASSRLTDPAKLPLFSPRQALALVYAETDLPAETRAAIDRFYTETLAREELNIGADEAIRKIIQELSERGTKLGIVSSRREQELRERVQQLGFAKFFPLVVLGRDSLEGGKSRALMHAATQFGCAPEQMLFVGDSDSDYSAAREAKVPYYHAAWGGEPFSLARGQALMRLNDVEDLAAALSDVGTAPLSSSTGLPRELTEAVRRGHFSFFAGAGASIPSGLGGWKEQYLPLLKAIGAGPYVDAYESESPQLLQLFASDPVRAREIFTRFSESFEKAHKPNPYHYALLKSKCEHIWTINYDNLFERALFESQLDFRVVKNDEELLQHFGSHRLLVKMNGDFEGAKYDDALDWGMVFLAEQFDIAEYRRREIWRLLEDDYRSKSIIFVGVSFQDPSLRRLITAASKNIPRTRYSHYLLTKAPSHPAEWVMFDLYRKYLKRYFIETLCFKDFGAIERFVRQVAVVANRPVIGFSGSMPQDEAPLPGGTTSGEAVGALCKQLGRSLAERGYRVTSGHGNIVGVESVEGAFEVNPLGARFYLRPRGKTQFSRIAPAVIVPGDSLERMRDRFIPECDLLFAIGGDPTVEPGSSVSGTVSEIERAESLGIPVLIFKQAGGAAGAYADKYLSRVGASYGDKALAKCIHDANRSLQELSPQGLQQYFASDMRAMIENVLAESFGSFTKRQDKEFEPW